MRAIDGRAASGTGESAVTVLAAITAAGLSRRMGRPKPLLRSGNETLLARMIRAIRDAGLPAPGVVVGAYREPVVAEARRWGGIPLENPDFDEGRFGSVRVAADWALGEAGQRAALLLWPVDCPGVAVATLRQLAAAAAAHGGADIVPTYGGRGGHPVVLCHATLLAIGQADAAGHLRDLIGSARGGRREIEVSDAAVRDNVNTPEQFEEFLRRQGDRAARRRIDG